MSSSQDPAVTDETGPTQQLLWILPEEHHLPRRDREEESFSQDH